MNKLELFEEHGKLVNKMFGDDGLDPEEEERLKQIRNEIDRIEEKQYGSHLDMVDNFLLEIEEATKGVMEDVQALREEDEEFEAEEDEDEDDY